MRWMLRMSVVCAVAALAVAVGAGPAAAVSASYTATGFEIAATSTEGTFVGTAQGSDGDAATWQAVVRHTPVSQTAPATITGGSLTLLAYDQHGLETVTGTFTGGTVTFISAAPGCSTENFAIDATLATTKGPATLSGTLTHYRFPFFGRCTTYMATVSATLRFT